MYIRTFANGFLVDKLVFSAETGLDADFVGREDHTHDGRPFFRQLRPGQHATAVASQQQRVHVVEARDGVRGGAGGLRVTGGPLFWRQTEQVDVVRTATDSKQTSARGKTFYVFLFSTFLCFSVYYIFRTFFIIKSWYGCNSKWHLRLLLRISFQSHTQNTWATQHAAW